MNRNQKLDAILKYMGENIGEIPARPTFITEKAGLSIDESEAYSMLYMLRSDGYVFSKISSSILIRLNLPYRCLLIY